MLTILVAVASYTLVMLLLVGVLLIARKALVPSGSVTVRVNGGGEHDIQGVAGDTLLTLLAQAGVFLPAACGGQGTCGTCGVRVGSGGGMPLPTEAAHISRGEARDGWRLACQLKVKNDIEVELRPEVFGVGHWSCTVRSARNVATFIREIVLELPAGEEIDFRAGAYVLVECPPHQQRFADFSISDVFRPDWGRLGLLELESTVTEPASRAYSMANHPAERDVIILNVRIATPPSGSESIPPGVVSTYLFGLRPGDVVRALGPFGDFFVEESEAEMVFVGGGAGMAPMRSMILDQLEGKGTQRKISFWYGARAEREAFYVDLFDRLAAAHGNFEWHLALSDPEPGASWDGYRGFIHEVLYANHLKDHPAPEDVEYYLCGPPAMIAATRRMLDNLGVEAANIRFDDFGS